MPAVRVFLQPVIWLAALAAASGLAGCSDARVPQPRDADPQGPSPLGKLVKLSSPVTEDELQAFLKLVRQLPEGEYLEFQPVRTPLPTAPTGTPSELVARWRTEFRSGYDPRRQAQQWRRDPELARVFAESGADPEAVAGFLVRMSSALVRDAVSSQVDLRDVARRAELQIAELSRQLDDVAAPDDPSGGTTSTAYVQDYALLVDGLRETTAFSEFVRLVQAAPEASLAVVRQHRDELSRYQPPQEIVAQFERRLETDAVVVPASAVRR
jgi:hypothetical protein